MVFMAINLFWYDLLVLNTWNISWALKILYEINFPAIKADFDISVGSHAFNLWHNTLEMILYHTLQKFIGLSSIILASLSVLGIKQMFVMFNLVSIFPWDQEIIDHIKHVLLYNTIVLEEQFCHSIRPMSFLWVYHKQILSNYPPSQSWSTSNSFDKWWLVWSHPENFQIPREKWH